MQKIYHETVDTKIIDYLHSIDFRKFHEMATDSTKKYKDLYVELFFTLDNKGELELCSPVFQGAKYRITVLFEIDFNNMSISKDKEYYAVSLHKKSTIIVGIFKKSDISRSLQQLFNDYLEKYDEWLRSFDDEK